RLNVVNYHHAATFDHSEHNLLADWPASLNHFRSLGLVHIAGLRADEGFINFDFASELVKTLVLHCKPDAMKHEPSGLLRDAKTAMDFVRTDSVFAGDDEPSGSQPLLQLDR